MEPFKKHTGIVAPLDRANIDTDAIIPKQFLRETTRKGFGIKLFFDWRYVKSDPSKENPDFILNRSEYRKATILLTRENFGCGSSREHAPWALADFGFRAIIAPSFAEIFHNNTVKNGILAVILKPSEIDDLFKIVNTSKSVQFTVDLMAQTVSVPDGKSYKFTINPFTKNCLLKGLDSISFSEQFLKQIKAFEAKQKIEKPWLFSK